MDHYLEIRILPDPEFAATLLMNAFYSKLHRALVKLQSTDIGISFPHYGEKKWLGERVRLHSSRERLEQLMNNDWLIGMNDHIRIGTVSPVPASVKHAFFYRVQTKSSAERIRRRQMRRHNLTAEEALRCIPDTLEKNLNVPFINIKSHSTKQAFRLFIEKELVSTQAQGTFNSYGLSKEASVPLF